MPSTATPPKQKKRGLGGAEENTHKILDSRRAQNIAIVLARLPFSTEILTPRRVLELWSWWCFYDLRRKYVFRVQPDGSFLVTEDLKDVHGAVSIAVNAASMQELAMKLRFISTEDMNLDLLQKVELVLPTPEETADFRQYLKKASDNASGVLPLRDVEAKLLPLIPLSRLTSKTRIMKTSLNASKVIDEMNTSLGLLSRAADEARDSNKFRVVLQAVLQWGNYVNHGYQMAGAAREVEASSGTTTGLNDRAEAKRVTTPDGETASGGKPSESDGEKKALPIRGFTLPSLLKLMEFKTAVDPTMTSLHFILVNLMATLPDLNLQDLPKDMPSVDAAARVSEEAVDALAGYLISEATFIASQITQLEKDGDPLMTKEETALEVQRLHRLHGQMVFAVEDLRHKYDNCKAKVADLGRFYGDEPRHADSLAAKRNASSMKKAASTPLLQAGGSGAGDGKMAEAGGSAVSIGGVPALRPWEGGLLEFSPFETLAAILKHFRHTLRELQVNPRKYLVLLVGERTEAQKNSLLKSRFGQVSIRPPENSSRGAVIDRQAGQRSRGRIDGVKSIASGPVQSQGPHRATQGEPAVKAKGCNGREAVCGEIKNQGDVLLKAVPERLPKPTESLVGGVTLQSSTIVSSEQGAETQAVCKPRSGGTVRPATRVPVANNTTTGERTVDINAVAQQGTEGEIEIATESSPRGASVGARSRQLSGVLTRDQRTTDGGADRHEGLSTGGPKQGKVQRCVPVHFTGAVSSALVPKDSSDLCERTNADGASTTLARAPPEMKTEARSQRGSIPHLSIQSRISETEHRMTVLRDARSGGTTEALSMSMQNGESHRLGRAGAGDFGTCSVGSIMGAPEATVDHLQGRLTLVQSGVPPQEARIIRLERPDGTDAGVQSQGVAIHTEPQKTNDAASTSSFAASASAVHADKHTGDEGTDGASLLVRNMLCDTQGGGVALGTPASSSKSLDSSFLSCESPKEAEDCTARDRRTEGEGARATESLSGSRVDTDSRLLQLPQSAVTAGQAKERLASDIQVRTEGSGSSKSQWLESSAFSPCEPKSDFAGPKSGCNASLSPLNGLQPAFSNMALAASIDKALFARSPLHLKKCPKLDSHKVLRAPTKGESGSALAPEICEEFGRLGTLGDGKSCDLYREKETDTVHKAAGARPLMTAVEDSRSGIGRHGLGASYSINEARRQAEAPKEQAVIPFFGEIEAASSSGGGKTEHPNNEIQGLSVRGLPLCEDAYRCGGEGTVAANNGHTTSPRSPGVASGEREGCHTPTIETRQMVPSAVLSNTRQGDTGGRTCQFGVKQREVVVDMPQDKRDSNAGGNLDCNHQRGKAGKYHICGHPGTGPLNLVDVKLRPSTPLFTWNSTGAIVGHAAGDRAAPTRQKRIRCRVRQPPPPIISLHATESNPGTSQTPLKATHKAGGRQKAPAYTANDDGEKC